MGQLFSREGAVALRNSVREKMGRGNELTTSLLLHFNKLHSIAERHDDKDIETLLLRQKEYEISLIGKKPDYPKDLPKFTPSSADKCDRELLFKTLKVEKDDITYPFQERWTRNSSAVHAAVQRDLLYAEKLLENPAFTVERVVSDNPLLNGLPAWEKNIQTYKIIEHNGVKFVVYGMMDGILRYKDGTRIGFEFKTKTNSISQLSPRQLKDAGESHKRQCVAYSILFGIDEFIILYESVAKDKWNANELAKEDLRAFYVKVTEEQRQKLLDKWARVAECYETGELIDGDNTKCLFCPFKTECAKHTGGIRQ
jgi:hypothetical protein